VRMDGLETVLEPTAAQAVAVVLHELATNASKYGALSDAKGQVRLTWSRSDDGQLTLRWTELGGPRVDKPERKGFGSRLIEGTISQLGGNARFDWRSEELVCEIAVRTWQLLLLARLRNLHGWNRCLLSGVVQTRFAPSETFGP
jgi:two-component sensor histidine kinase